MSLQNQKDIKLRLKYCAAFFVFLAIEVFIALFVHDSFVRPYVGDVLVVVVLYCAVRSVIPRRYKLLPLYIFIFSVIVEILQYFDIVRMLGFENNTFMRVLIGSTFDVKDILCYGVGCIFLAVFEFFLRKDQNLIM